MKHPVGPRLSLVLSVVFGLFALLVVNSVYLAGITTAQWASGQALENQFYQWMFGGHLALGLLFVVPFVVFAIVHLANTHDRPNRSAVRAGWILLWASVGVLLTGVLLTNVDVGGREVGLRNPDSRRIAYWLHVILPVAAIWLYVLHRLSGRRIRWKVGVRWGAVAAVFAVAMVALHGADARPWSTVGPRNADYFEPSLARTASGGFIPAEGLMMNEYCLECHQDTYDSWAHSVHAASSFNNPLYAFSVRETRRQAHAREGSVQDARFCAGCHDPVPFFSGAFEHARFDDPDYDVAKDPLGAASITCTACHSIVAVNSPRGNADYTIEESRHYPFAFSDNPFLKWVNRQLVKAKPSFHKQTFLKPEVHRSAEFCGTCHKVNLPEAVNDYRWLRGQNHYDSFRLSGVSGHGVESWYYPARAESNCNGCHMQARPSDDFGAKVRDGRLAILDHGFASANPATPLLSGLTGAETVQAECEAFLQGTMRVDLFGIRRGSDIDAPLEAPLDPMLPTVSPGESLLVEVVTRTLKLGHEFTQGTADSNEVWLDVTVRSGDRVIGRSGGVDADRAVDPWSKFFNVFMLDRAGNRIDRRNPQDIFVPLYNNQVPPGAGDVTHFGLTLPADLTDPVTIEVALRYRKFDTTYMHYAYPGSGANTVPVLTLATDSVTLPLASGAAPAESGPASSTSPTFPEWQRWYDYAIGLFRQGNRGSQKGDLRGAEVAFSKVEALGRGEGALGLARAYLKEGRLDDAVAALARAGQATNPAYPWSIAWFSAQVDRQNGNFEAAVRNMEAVKASAFPLAIERGFDFSHDDRLRVDLAQVQYEWSRAVQSSDPAKGRDLLARSRANLEAALALDPENAQAWYVLSQVATEQGDRDLAERARAQHATYKLDDNARDAAITVARARYPAANHAAEPIVIFDLQRPGRFEASIAAPAPTRPQASTGPSMPAAVRGLTGLGAQASEAAVRSVHGSGSSE
jgi:tetratricopeptide (TPR) repeat protein